MFFYVYVDVAKDILGDFSPCAEMLHCTPSHIFTTDKVTITYIIERERE